MGFFGWTPSQSGTGVKDYQEAAESFSAAAREIRLGLTELQKPLDNQAAGEFRGLVDIIFWRSVILVAIIFVLGVIYYLTKPRFPQKSLKKGNFSKFKCELYTIVCEFILHKNQKYDYRIMVKQGFCL